MLESVLLNPRGPIVFLKIEPKSRADRERLAQGLRKLMAEDPGLDADVDDETGHTIIRGAGELHAEIILDRLMREFRGKTFTPKPGELRNVSRVCNVEK